jgi:hypothetical protein
MFVEREVALEVRIELGKKPVFVARVESEAEGDQLLRWLRESEPVDAVVRGLERFTSAEGFAQLCDNPEWVVR